MKRAKERTLEGTSKQNERPTFTQKVRQYGRGRLLMWVAGTPVVGWDCGARGHSQRSGCGPSQVVGHGVQGDQGKRRRMDGTQSLLINQQGVCPEEINGQQRLGEVQGKRQESKMKRTMRAPYVRMGLLWMAAEQGPANRNECRPTGQIADRCSCVDKEMPPGMLVPDIEAMLLAGRYSHYWRPAEAFSGCVLDDQHRRASEPWQ